MKYADLWESMEDLDKAIAQLKAKTTASGATSGEVYAAKKKLKWLEGRKQIKANLDALRAKQAAQK